MSFLDKLKSIINVDLSGIKGINIQILSGNRKTEIINNILVVDPVKLKSKQKGKFQEVLKEALNENAIIIEDKSNKLLEDFKNTDSREDSQKILEYFSNKIPSTDLEIVRASIYLKSIHDKDSNPELTSKIKLDIIQRWGQRGANIANLYTAGYFLTVVKPLYEELSSKPGFNKAAFYARYETIIMQFPFAIFVNRAMSINELKSNIEAKIKINKRYGIKNLNIHAIGVDNIQKIKTALIDLKDLLTEEPEIDSGRNYIIVTIWF